MFTLKCQLCLGKRNETGVETACVIPVEVLCSLEKPTSSKKLSHCDH